MKYCSNARAVIGLGFGDEGKGLVTDFLCQKFPDSLVVRYSGGQQAGHTVTTDNTSHVFSNFGSGTFAGTPTYWSKYCTVDPVGIMREFKVLQNKGHFPILYLDSQCPITTPYEKTMNHLQVGYKRHGTCGVGVGSTFEREEDFYSFTAGDLECTSIVEIKMKLLATWYECLPNPDMEEFYEALGFIKTYQNIQIVHDTPKAKNVIFEGSQGLLLDQHNGFFPHVTRSNTGTKNILDMGTNPDLWLVTRAYQTRHGNGPMTNEDIPHNIIDNPKETNVTNEFQGEFRKSVLDLDLLKYAVTRDAGIRDSQSKKLIITCCDLIDGEFQYTWEGNLVTHPNKEAFASAVGAYLHIPEVYVVDGPDKNPTPVY